LRQRRCTGRRAEDRPRLRAPVRKAPQGVSAATAEVVQALALDDVGRPAGKQATPAVEQLQRPRRQACRGSASGTEPPRQPTRQRDLHAGAGPRRIRAEHDAGGLARTEARVVDEALGAAAPGIPALGRERRGEAPAAANARAKHAVTAPGEGPVDVRRRPRSRRPDVGTCRADRNRYRSDGNEQEPCEAAAPPRYARHDATVAPRRATWRGDPQSRLATLGPRLSGDSTGRFSTVRGPDGSTGSAMTIDRSPVT
jgi:hypothetical protein